MRQLCFSGAPVFVEACDEESLKECESCIAEKESEKHLKASMTVVITDYRKIRYGYVGNTRLRMYRGSTVYKQTQDMSLAQELLEEDKIAQDELVDVGEK